MSRLVTLSLFDRWSVDIILFVLLLLLLCLTLSTIPYHTIPYHTILEDHPSNLFNTEQQQQQQ